MNHPCGTVPPHLKTRLRHFAIIRHSYPLDGSWHGPCSPHSHSWGDMELELVRHLSKEIEAGNGGWAMVVANEQLDPQHPLRRAFLRKAARVSMFTKSLQAELSAGKRLTELSLRHQREVRRSKFSFIDRVEKPALRTGALSARWRRSYALRLGPVRRDHDA